jgi:hydrogenase maturation protease
MSERAQLLVLGLGNVLCGDDGAGVEAVCRLVHEHEVDERVLVLDGGTLGLALLPYLETAERVILVDAIVGDDPPGTIVRAEGDEVPTVARHKLSCHQIGVSDLLECARMIEIAPEVTLIGIVAESVESLGRPSAAVTSGMNRLVECVAEEIRRRGFSVQHRGRSEAGIDEYVEAYDGYVDGSVDDNDTLDRSHADGTGRHRWM